MIKKVVIISDHSIFAEGVARRFEEFPERVEMHFINPRNENSFDQILAIQPEAIILNSSEAEMKEKCLLCELLSGFPSIRIIRLAVDQTPVQVITSEQNFLNEVRDLLDLINSN